MRPNAIMPKRLEVSEANVEDFGSSPIGISSQSNSLFAFFLHGKLASTVINQLMLIGILFA